MLIGVKLIFSSREMDYVHGDKTSELSMIFITK